MALSLSVTKVCSFIYLIHKCILIFSNLSNPIYSSATKPYQLILNNCTLMNEIIMQKLIFILDKYVIENKNEILEYSILIKTI